MWRFSIATKQQIASFPTINDKLMQRFVSQADHIVKVFIVHIGMPEMLASAQVLFVFI